MFPILPTVSINAMLRSISKTSEVTIKIARLRTTGRGVVKVTLGPGVTVHIFISTKTLDYKYHYNSVQFSLLTYQYYFSPKKETSSVKLL